MERVKREEKFKQRGGFKDVKGWTKLFKVNFYLNYYNLKKLIFKLIKKSKYPSLAYELESFLA